MIKAIILVALLVNLRGVRSQCNAIIDSYATTAQQTMINSDYYVQTGLGLNTGKTLVEINGFLDVFSAASTRNLLSALGTGSTAWTVPTGTSVASFISTSANDDGTGALGNGCRTILVEGLSGAGAVTTESLNLNGAAAVSTVNTYSFVNKISCTAVGTDRRNVGTIRGVTAGSFTVDNLPAIGIIGSGLTSVAGNAVAPFGVSASSSAIYRVPTGFTYNLLRIYAAVAKPGTGVTTNTGIYIFYKTDTALPGAPYTLYKMITVENDGANSIDIPVPFGFRFAAGTTIWAEAQTGTTPAAVQLIMSGILY
jgi:hypothetical protein